MKVPDVSLSRALQTMTGSLLRATFALLPHSNVGGKRIN